MMRSTTISRLWHVKNKLDEKDVQLNHINFDSRNKKVHHDKITEVDSTSEVGVLSPFLTGES